MLDTIGGKDGLHARNKPFRIQLPVSGHQDHHALARAFGIPNQEHAQESRLRACIEGAISVPPHPFAHAAQQL